MITAKKRPRRIAADEAHSWARNLRLRNVSAKAVLTNLTLYVDGDGSCWVGIPSLAEDLEMSPDTIRRRLVWLEDVGAIARTPQWVDGYGVRNKDGRGKRTSDLIHLLINADIDAIEARAAGCGPHENTGYPVPLAEAGCQAASSGSEISPPQQSARPAVSGEISPGNLLGLNSPAGEVSPRLALCQPSHCCEGLISEPEPEDSPKAPFGGVNAPEQGEEEGEPEHFAEAWEIWPGHQLMRRDLAVAEFRKLAPDEHRLCRAAIPHFFVMQQHHKRDFVPNFHIWVRHRGFREFPAAVIADRPEASQGLRGFDVTSREGRAIRALYGFARASPFEHRGRVSYSLPVTAGVLAFAEPPPEAEWCWIDAPAQVAAWSTFLRAHIPARRPDLLTTRTIDGEARRGFMAPWPWPPRKDGTIAAGETGESA